MQAHDLKKPKQKIQRRVGRGGKRGTYSGRGMKGQKSRAGANIRPQIWDYILRTPKHTGTTHKASGNMGRSKVPMYYVNINELDKVAQKGDIVDVKFLIKNNLVRYPKGRSWGNVKLLASGELTKDIIVKGLFLSKNAKESVEKAGGKVEK